MYAGCSELRACGHIKSDCAECDPGRALELREQYPGIIEPAWHWNKKYWNQIRYDKLPEAKVKELIAESFRLVIDKLPKKIQKELFETI